MKLKSKLWDLCYIMTKGKSAHIYRPIFNKGYNKALYGKGYHNQYFYSKTEFVFKGSLKECKDFIKKEWADKFKLNKN